MEMVSVRCNHCGAPLEVGETTRFVTCQFCDSQLEVKHTESSVFTEEISRIARTTEKMSGKLDVISLQNEIEQLDREWEAQQPQINSQGRSRSPQSGFGAVVGMLFSVVFALVCFRMAGTMGSVGAPAIVPLIPVGMGIFALVAGAMSMVQWTNRQEKLAGYQRQRDELIRKLAEKKQD